MTQDPEQWSQDWTRRDLILEVEHLRFVVEGLQIANRQLARDLQALGGPVTEIISQTLKINPRS